MHFSGGLQLRDLANLRWQGSAACRTEWYSIDFDQHSGALRCTLFFVGADSRLLNDGLRPAQRIRRGIQEYRLDPFSRRHWAELSS